MLDKDAMRLLVDPAAQLRRKRAAELCGRQWKWEREEYRETHGHVFREEAWELYKMQEDLLSMVIASAQQARRWARIAFLASAAAGCFVAAVVLSH